MNKAKMKLLYELLTKQQIIWQQILYKKGFTTFLGDSGPVL